jgi:hypothetical protein
MPNPRGRWELVATQDTGRIWSERYDTLAEALVAAEAYRATPPNEQVWEVVIRNKSYGTGELEVANQTVVYELPE